MAHKEVSVGTGMGSWCSRSGATPRARWGHSGDIPAMLGAPLPLLRRGTSSLLQLHTDWSWGRRERPEPALCWGQELCQPFCPGLLCTPESDRHPHQGLLLDICPLVLLWVTPAVPYLKFILFSSTSLAARCHFHINACSHRCWWLS